MHAIYMYNLAYLSFAWLLMSNFIIKNIFNVDQIIKINNARLTWKMPQFTNMNAGTILIHFHSSECWGDIVLYASFVVPYRHACMQAHEGRQSALGHLVPGDIPH